MQMEDAAGEFTSQIQFFFKMYFLLALVIFGAQSIQTYDFKNYVSSKLQSHGGLTSEASKDIQNYSNKYYFGRYKVSSDVTSKQPYGTDIDYTVNGKIQIFFMDVPDQLTKKPGSTTSLVR
ncbi:hypothetical protein [Bacillus pumilus]|uniref:hypothetical protein n=1 Tax=Bacillus pumilus TaxID=1408 RepID=UPI0011A8B037|nr:hypothetical protein [Bacillus pumilus]